MMHPYIAFQLITSTANAVKRPDEYFRENRLTRRLRAVYYRAIAWLLQDC